MCVHCLWGADLDSKISKMWRKNQSRGTERLPGDFGNFSHPHEPNRSNSREKAGFIEDSVWEYRLSCGKTYGRRGVRQQGEGCGTRDLWDQEKTWSRSEAEARPNPENLILRSAVGSLPHLHTLTSCTTSSPLPWASTSLLPLPY